LHTNDFSYRNMTFSAFSSVSALPSGCAVRSGPHPATAYGCAVCCASSRHGGNVADERTHSESLRGARGLIMRARGARFVQWV